jgi:hypothetical protein
MSVKYFETDITDEGQIRWYGIDGEMYGFDSEGVILGAGGSPITDEVKRRYTILQIAKFEAFK